MQDYQKPTEAIPGLVSIITPTYNRGQFLAQAIQSVLDQSYPNFELLIVDDGSTDNTSEVIEPFLEDRRVRHFKQSNQGQSVARSMAYAQSRGEFVALLDSDDWWAESKLERTIEIFNANPYVGLVYCGFLQVDHEGGEITRQNMRGFNGKATAKLLRDNFVNASSAVVRRRCLEKIGGIQPRFKVADDYDLWLRISTTCDFHHIPECLAYYRQTRNSISSDKTARFSTNEQILRSFLQDYPSVLDTWEIRDGWSCFYNRRGRYFAQRRMSAKALNDYIRSIKAHPFTARPWRSIAAMFYRGVRDKLTGAKFNVESGRPNLR